MTYRDIRMKMLEDELVTAIGESNDARREVTRLSNYETSYNDLQQVVNSQYRNIDALTGQLARVENERDGAQARLRKANCDYGDGWLSDDLECGVEVEPWCGKHAVLYYIKAIDKWDVVFREMEGMAATFLAERDEARETIEAMRKEGCAAAAVLEDIFNGVTAAGVNHGDSTIATVASRAAVALTSVPRCEHEEEIRGLKQLAYNFLDFTPNCGDDNKCFTCGEQWYPNKCEISCLHAMLFKATREANDTSAVWLELCDARDDAVAALELVREWRGRGGALLELDPILKAAP